MIEAMGKTDIASMGEQVMAQAKALSWKRIVNSHHLPLLVHK